MADFSRADEHRAEVIALSRRMTADRLVVGTSGNVSMRCGDLIAVTPSGVDYDQLTVPDVPLVDPTGRVVEGGLRPTSELDLHLVAHQRHGAHAVVHTHALHATALSLLRDDVPPVHYQLADFGGSVRVAEYATYGTADLAEAMSTAMSGSAGCVLRNHGTVTIGPTLRAAYNRAQQLEWLCQLWLTASQVGQPRTLDETQLARAAERMTSYGQSSAPAADT